VAALSRNCQPAMIGEEIARIAIGRRAGSFRRHRQAIAVVEPLAPQHADRGTPICVSGSI
jgi:hypothetical protein